MAQISDDEAQRLLEFVCATARAHTDVILVVPKDGGDAALASCIHIDWNGRRLVLTCNHALRAEHAYFTSPTRVQNSVIDENTRYQVHSLRFLSATQDLDIAVFEGTDANDTGSGKTPYVLADSSWFAPEKLDASEGVAAFIYGLLGNKARGHQYPDGLVYLEAPIYTGLGPLVQVVERELVADMAEKRIVTLNDKDFPQLKGEVATGGVRDLQGSSGSGLWMVLDRQPCLLGIVLGRNPSPAGTHLIRATPIWSVRRWLEQALTTEQ
ncbi:hypothetical protein WME73_02475 [Sorangium sp. So ce302]|uniref:hypothetical protein n=1 Tax=unclassified Sorangium TaxID=2621164 RepID=UPI003F61E144